MSRTICRTAIAALTLALCLLVAVPQVAEARPMEPSHVERLEGESQQEREIGFWESVWSTLRSLWGRSGIFIDPYGQDGQGGGEGEGQDDDDDEEEPGGGP